MIRSVAIAGASLAGLRSAESLRREGFDGEIVLIGAEDELPYDRPPLSKQYLRGEWDDARVQLRDPDRLASLELTFVLGRRATALRVGDRRLELDDDSTISFDALIIATGARAWTPPGWDLDGVATLRTVGDARNLRQAMERTGHIVIVGGGFIGCEVAASARHLGVEVTLIEALDSPLSRVLGPMMGEYCAALHRANGVTLSTGIAVRELVERDGHVRGVRLDNGDEIATDLVLVSLGVRPETEWLASSGLDLDDGVVCTASCVAGPDIYAVGDVARWPYLDRLRRVEHWTNASEQAACVARNLMRGADEPPVEYQSVPYFWSDLYATKIQAAGLPQSSDETEVLAGSIEEGRFAVGYHEGDTLTGVVTANWPGVLGTYRRLLESGPSWDAALEQARSFVKEEARC